MNNIKQKKLNYFLKTGNQLVIFTTKHVGYAKNLLDYEPNNIPMRMCSFILTHYLVLALLM